MDQSPPMPPSSDEPTQPVSQPLNPQASGPLPPPPPSGALPPPPSGPLPYPSQPYPQASGALPPPPSGPLPYPSQPYPQPSGQIPPPGYYPQMPPTRPMPPPMMPTQKKGFWSQRLSLPVWGAVILCLVLCSLGYGVGRGASGSAATSNTGSVSQAATATTAPQNQPTKAPTKATTPTPTPTPAPTFPHFGDGTFEVGKDIQPGTYRTRVGSDSCYYARLKGFSGSLDDIIANNDTTAPAIVTIAATDKGFESDGCGTWTQDLSQITPSQTSFGDGMFIIGTDITPGTYRNTGGQGCYYARLRGFGNTLDDIIANNDIDTPTIVTISASDKGFQSSNCGTWTKE